MNEIGKLVFTRGKKESAVIDLRQWGLGLIEVHNAGKRGQGTQFCFEGERRIPIWRRELFDKREAAANDDTTIIDDGGPTL